MAPVCARLVSLVTMLPVPSSPRSWVALTRVNNNPSVFACNYTCFAFALAVACPVNSAGTDGPSGCTCNAGFIGSVSATQTAPDFYTSTCAVVSCPRTLPEQTSLPAAHACNAGYAGSVTATQIAPNYYTSVMDGMGQKDVEEEEKEEKEEKDVEGEEEKEGEDEDEDEEEDVAVDGAGVPCPSQANGAPNPACWSQESPFHGDLEVVYIIVYLIIYIYIISLFVHLTI